MWIMKQNLTKYIELGERFLNKQINYLNLPILSLLKFRNTNSIKNFFWIKYNS